jgi:predicted transcriptional regulator
MKTATATMTDKQRRALEAMNAAREQGCSLTEYAQAHGLLVRELYDALAALRRKGVLPKGRAAKSRFVSVRVAPAATTMAMPLAHSAASSVVCRVVTAGSCAIECLQWPEPRWLAALSMGSTDAAS